VATGNATVKIIGHVKKGRIAIGDLCGKCEQIVTDWTCLDGAPDASEHVDCTSRPYAPMAEQPAIDPHFYFGVVARNSERGHQIEHDVVIVSGIKANAILGARRNDATDHIQRAITVERRDLDRYDLLNFSETAPKVCRQRNAAYGGLQIKAEKRNAIGDRATMRDQFAFTGSFHCGQTQEPGMIAEISCDRGFALGLRGSPHKPGNEDERPL